MRAVKKITTRVVGAMSAVCLLAVLGCEASLKDNGNRIEDLISGVTDASGTIDAVLHHGEAPHPNGGPSHTVAGFAAMVNGGSSQQTLTGAAAFTRIIIASSIATNYYELTVPSGSVTPIIVRAAHDLPNMNLGVSYAVGDAGNLGAYTEQTIKIIHVGTGDVQVSVSWNTATDVDLHVVEPSLEEVYFGHARTPSTSLTGGTLDLDSNPACAIDNKDNENIVWPVGQAPHGTYTVRVAYYADCGVAATDYVVTVAVKGQQPQVFTGTFAGPGTGGGAGAGTTITTFTF